tara:strand:+ start:735 stop:3659 length:2925 start_codon:yes stop_codon:yes gene_type:complete
MKKILKILGIVILVLLILLFTLPYLFRGQIFDLVKEQANANLNATVDIEDLDLSLFENFPDFTVTISNVKVENKAPFEGVTLAKIGEIKASLDLMSVLSGSNYEINTVGLSDVDAHVIVTKDGIANYDITVPSADTATAEEEEVVEEETTDEESSPFNINIKEYYLRNVNVIYDDQQGDMYAKVDNLTFEGSGDVSLENYLFETKTTADAITYIMDGVPYMSDVKTDITFNIQIDQAKNKYTFMENEVKLNDLTLGFDGWLAITGYPIVMDMTFEAKETEFKNILSLVPAVYTKDFESVQTSGILGLKGSVKGTYVDREDKLTVPGFDVSLIVKNAMFKYPDMPSQVDNINIDIQATCPGENIDATYIDVNQFHVEIAENPVDVQMHVRRPVTDPRIKGDIVASIDLASIAEVIPMEEGESYTGNITSDIHLEGKMSAIEEERYEDFKAEGKLIVLGFDYKSEELPYEVQLKKMYMDFSPQYVDLTQFEAYVGKSDISANGKIDNMLGYYFKDEPLTGTFNLNSNLMDLNELMAEDSTAAAEETTTPEETTGETAETETDSTSSGVFEVPANINFALQTNIKQLIYDNMEMTNVNGKVTMANSELNLDHLKLNMLDGELDISGGYNTENALEPSVNFDMDIKNFDVQKTATTFNTIEKLAPVLMSATGKLSTSLTLTGLMDENMEMKLNTLNGEGLLKTKNVKVENDVLQKINDALNSEQYNPLKVDNVDISYEIKDGKLETKPFDIKADQSTATVYGYSTFEQKMDYTMDVEMPVSQFGNAAQDAVNSLLQQVQDAGINTGDLGQKIKVKVKIEGDMMSPTVKPVFNGGSGSSKTVKETITETIDKAKDMVNEKAKEEAEKLVAEAKAQKAKLVAEAEKQAAKLHEEAEKQAADLVKQGEKEAQKLVDEASNPIAKKLAETAAKAAKAEAEKQAKKIVEEADKEGAKLVTAAEAQGDKLIEEAQKKADEQLGE